MIGEFKFDGGIQNLLAIALVIALGIYVYLELRKIKNDIRDIKTRLLPEQSLPEQSLPEQSLPKQSLPEQSLPEQSLPEQSLPEQSLPPRRDHPMSLFSTPSEMHSPLTTEYNISEISSHEDVPITNEDSISELQKLMETDEGILGKRNTIEDTIEDTTENTTEDTVIDDDIRLISADSPESKYSAMTVSDLKAILQEHNLPLSGNKTKLIKRIQDNVIISKIETSHPEQINTSG